MTIKPAIDRIALLLGLSWYEGIRWDGNALWHVYDGERYLGAGTTLREAKRIWYLNKPDYR